MYQAEDVGKMDTFWQEQMSEPAVKNMLEQPRKHISHGLIKRGKTMILRWYPGQTAKGLSPLI